MEEDRAATNLGPTPEEELSGEPNIAPKQPKKRFVGRRAAESAAAAKAKADPNANIEDSGAIQVAQPRRTARALNNIPASILEDPDINAAISLLPSNYNFEIHKTIHRIRQNGHKSVALQLPEGLLLFATTISDILTQFCPGITTTIMGDVTYGACCIDDFTARALGCDLLVHYAHSCLIPVAVTKIATLYVFVSIGIDTQHLADTIVRNFKPGQTIAMVGTIQFNATIHGLAPQLRREGYNIIVPQIMPLSKGEILGCTSPRFSTPKQKSESLAVSAAGKASKDAPIEADCLLYLGDGRFHLESAQIHNPHLPSYRYDPYSRRLTHETYAHTEMYSIRASAIETARKARKWGLILGALGRQGNPHTLTLIENHLKQKGIPCMKILLSEIFPGKLQLMSATKEEKKKAGVDEDGANVEDGGVEAWVQIACPRLSIDWGYAFPRPLLSPYEALVALGVQEGKWMEKAGQEDVGEDVYPMDFYGKEGLGRTTMGGVQVRA
ncbi:Diphthamide biosynthesis protein 1 [Lasiodiplodia hormozganensis]|uniref:2-(3-amino-3-carboxypropyl)histidine synthase subunit 1 n=1 Tax=Lasiodiplodia hormozganensis TaxID=869390 RepID=A0AA39TJA3_9PEZI|nr:Diphthamide biosynthesis protein 1 [Lasiodiplodia hormozganensis]